MTRYFFLALGALLCLGVALLVACGGKGATNNYYIVDDDASPADDDDASPDDDDDSSSTDDDNDDDSATDDDDDNDDNDDSTGCSSAGYAQCIAPLDATYNACLAKCTGTACAADDCLWTCDVAWDAAFIDCDKEFSCQTELSRTQCWQTCNSAAIACLKPLTTCDAARAATCRTDWDSCLSGCPS